MQPALIFQADLLPSLRAIGQIGDEQGELLFVEGTRRVGRGSGWHG